MIGASTTGGSFGGLGNYLEGGGQEAEKMEWKEVRNLAGDHKEHYVRMMEDTAELSRAEKPVYHVSVSYAPEDNPSRAQMVADVDQVLKDLGLDRHQAVLVSHSDKDYKHVHAMVNRVHPETGKAWNPWQDQAKIKASLGRIEIERGYRQMSALEHEKGPMKRAEFMQAYHRGTRELPVAAKAEIGNFKQLLQEANGWDDINRGLAEYNCRVSPKGRGGVIEDKATGQTMKLSRIGREHSFGRLQKAHGKYSEYTKAIEASKALRSQIPDKKLHQAFTKLAAAKFGSKSGLKQAAAGFKTAARGASGLAKTAKTLKGLAASANPVSGAAKMGVGIIKKAMKLTKQQDRGMGR